MQWEVALQRLFSTFADGWPGLGLLLQRLLTGTILLYCGITHLGKASQFVPITPHTIAAGAGDTSPRRFVDPSRGSARYDC